MTGSFLVGFFFVLTDDTVLLSVLEYSSFELVSQLENLLSQLGSS